MPILKTVLLMMAFTMISACGVKGKPMPPADPAFIGNGKTIQENENLKKKNNPESKKKTEDSDG